MSSTAPPAGKCSRAMVRPAPPTRPTPSGKRRLALPPQAPSAPRPPAPPPQTVSSTVLLPLRCLIPSHSPTPAYGAGVTYARTQAHWPPPPPPVAPLTVRCSTVPPLPPSRRDAPPPRAPLPRRAPCPAAWPARRLAWRRPAGGGRRSSGGGRRRGPAHACGCGPAEGVGRMRGGGACRRRQRRSRSAMERRRRGGRERQRENGASGKDRVRTKEDGNTEGGHGTAVRRQTGQRGRETS